MAVVNGEVLGAPWKPPPPWWEGPMLLQLLPAKALGAFKPCSWGFVFHTTKQSFCSPPDAPNGPEV